MNDKIIGIQWLPENSGQIVVFFLQFYADVAQYFIIFKIVNDSFLRTFKAYRVFATSSDF